jgi:hypothetical protein
VAEQMHERPVAGMQARRELVEASATARTRVEARTGRVGFEVDEVRRLGAPLDEESCRADPFYVAERGSTEPLNVDLATRDGHRSSA